MLLAALSDATADSWAAGSYMVKGCSRHFVSCPSRLLATMSMSFLISTLCLVSSSALVSNSLATCVTNTGCSTTQARP